MITARAAIFDLDCTLVDTLHRFYELFNELLVERGEKPLEWNDFFKKYVDDSLDEVVEKLGKEKEITLHEFWMEFLWKYREGEHKWELIPGVKDTLQNLHKEDVPTAVITSCIVPAEKLKKELEAHGIGDFVDAVVTAHDVVGDLEKGHHFSKVEIFRLVAKKLGVDPKDSVVVGDYWNDIRDGKSVGAKTVAVLSGLMRRDLLQKYGPDAIIESVRELPKVVKFEK